VSTAILDPPQPLTREAETVDLEALWDRPAEEVAELACATHLGVWTARRLGLDMAAVHWEWTELAMTCSRLAVVAPRDHSKSSTFSVHATAWRSIYQPGIWSFLFAQTSHQAEDLLDRVKATLLQTVPDLVLGASVDRMNRLVLANGSRIDTAGAGKRVRSAHPDVIVGDDVLDDDNTASGLQRRKIHRWWFGSVVNMAHPPDVVRVRHPDGTVSARRRPATRIHLVGTPFHAQDLLMGMRTNPLWTFRRYAAEFDPAKLVPGTLAVEAT
jgi:hypothetical protein